ncbi:hypothetical protein BDQ17DRAFT_284785 [Cyathus striatus]|nr:hypothetical protein BDQ17DRAFT_284785 [Cyathus striatus]
MSSITDISSALGEYMLRGWVLTDHSCPNAGCAIPMLRSPNGKSPVVEFCVNCNKTPENTQDTPNQHTARIAYATSNSSLSQISRTSTPPTEVSDAMSLPDFPPPPETEHSRRRREQSDRASSEIGKRLLKGWAMLADECPNLDCYGVPLVRRPKAGGEKDPRKECVICESIYLTEVDWAGREQLIPESLQIPRAIPENTTSAVRSHTISEPSATVLPVRRTKYT